MYVRVHACFFVSNGTQQLGLLDLKVNTFAVQVYHLRRQSDGGCDCGCDLETTPGHLNPPGARITYGLQLQRLKVSHVTIYVHFKRPSVAEGQKQSSRT